VAEASKTSNAPHTVLVESLPGWGIG